MRGFLVSLFLVGFAASAEEKICSVTGMHCTGCTEMVEGKVCDEAKYSTCEVKVLDKKKKLGEVRLITKDTEAKVDEKALGAMIEDSGYKMTKCKTTGPKKKG